MTVRKLRKQSLSCLKKKAWKLFSEWVRRKAADYKETAACVSCGSVIPWKTGDAGHFIPKSRGLVYYFHEKNVHFQCKVCNIWNKEQAKIRYTLYMQNKYGPNIVQELEELSLHPAKYSRVDYEVMIETFKMRLENL